jgi:hypothetical protein
MVYIWFTLCHSGCTHVHRHKPSACYKDHIVNLPEDILLTLFGNSHDYHRI